MRDNAQSLKGKLVTVIADGVEVKANSGIYENAQVVLTDAFDHIPSWYTPRGIDAYRAALVVRKDGIVDNMSVVEAIQGGTYDDKKAEGITITSKSDNFAALICEGGEYTLKDVKLVFDSKSDGSDNGDFDAFGALIVGFDGAKIVLDNVDIYTKGVARAAIFCDSYANILTKNSKIHTMGGQLYAGYKNTCDQRVMVAPPWPLGLTGTVRSTNIMGDCGTSTFVNSEIVSDGWGVLSTDSGSDMILTVVDCLVKTESADLGRNPYLRRFGSGYGSYIIDDAQEFFRGVQFDVGTYAAVVCGGSATYTSSNGTFDVRPIYFVYDKNIEDVTNHFGKVTPGHTIAVSETPVFDGIVGKGNKTVINSDGWAFMAHDFGDIHILDGTEVNTDAGFFIHKDGEMFIEIDNAVMNIGNKVILQVMDNDDDAIGFNMDSMKEECWPRNVFNTEYNEPAGYPGIDYEAPGIPCDQTVKGKFTNVKLDGDFYNSSGYVLGLFGVPQGRKMDLTFGENAVVNGAICATSAIHVDPQGNQITHFEIDEYYHLGRLANKPHFNGANVISVELTDNAVWNVTGTSIITKLTIGENAKINGKATIDGQPLELVPGTYEGVITIEA